MRKIFFRFFKIAGIFGLLAFVASSYKVTVVRAVTETAGDLEITWDEPLFFEENMAPGGNVSAFITVKNTSSDEEQELGFEVEGKSGEDLASQFDLSVSNGGEITVKDSLAYFYSEEEIDLLILGPEEEAEFEFQAGFKTTAGNEYQGKNTAFDLIIGGVPISMEIGDEDDDQEASTEEAEPTVSDEEAPSLTLAGEDDEGDVLGDKNTVEDTDGKDTREGTVLGAVLPETGGGARLALIALLAVFAGLSFRSILAVYFKEG